MAGGAVGCRHTRLGLRRRFCGGRRWLEVVGPLRHAHLRASPRAAMQAAHSPDRAQAKAMPGYGGRPCLPSAWGLGPSNPATAAAAAPGRGGAHRAARRWPPAPRAARRQRPWPWWRETTPASPAGKQDTTAAAQARFMGSAARPTDNAPARFAGRRHASSERGRRGYAP